MIERNARKSLEQIVLDCQNYEQYRSTEICGMPLLGKLSPVRQSFERKADRLTGMLHRSPEVALAIIEGKVAGFHGTTSAGLHYIMSHGLMTAERAMQEDIPLSTGEREVSAEDGQPFVSFSDWREPRSIAEYSRKRAVPRTLPNLYKMYQVQQDDLTAFVDFARRRGLSEEEIQANNYTWNFTHRIGAIKRDIDFLEQNPKGLDAELLQLNFPVALGVTVGEMALSEALFVYPDVESGNFTVQPIASGDVAGEFLVYPKDGVIPFDQLPVMAVPEPYIETMQGLVDDMGYNSTRVVHLDPILTEV